MDYKKEIERRDKRMESYKKEVAELKEELQGLGQLLDCAVANLVLAVGEKGGTFKISQNEIRKVIGRYKLYAKKDEKDTYLLELKK